MAMMGIAPPPVITIINIRKIIIGRIKLFAGWGFLAYGLLVFMVRVVPIGLEQFAPDGLFSLVEAFTSVCGLLV